MRPFVQGPYERRGVTAEWGRALGCRDGCAALPLDQVDGIEGQGDGMRDRRQPDW